MPESFTIRDLQDLATKVCAGEQGWNVFEGVSGALEELKGRPEYCLDLNFMFSLLHTGYEMPLGRQVKIAKKINGNELGWCLGARYDLRFFCYPQPLYKISSPTSSVTYSCSSIAQTNNISA
jgi:guanosine-diphosphatase